MIKEKKSKPKKRTKRASVMDSTYDIVQDEYTKISDRVNSIFSDLQTKYKVPSSLVRNLMASYEDYQQLSILLEMYKTYKFIREAK